MLKNKKTMRIFSLILAISMLLSFAPTVMAEETTEETDSTGAMLYENYFDTASDVVNSGFVIPSTVKDQETGIEKEIETPLTESNFSDGNLKGANFIRLNAKIADKVTDNSIIVYQSKKKIFDFYNQNQLYFESGKKSLFLAGNTATNTGARIFSYDDDSDGVYDLYLTFANGGSAESTYDNHKFKTDYKINADEYYTYTIKYDKANNKVKAIVSNETQGTAESEWISYPYVNNIPFKFDYSGHDGWYYRGYYVDYHIIYDESKLPKAAASANDGVDTTAVKDEDKFTVTLENAITADELKASPITISDSNVDMVSELSEDGKKITLTLSNLGSSRSYKITVPNLGLNAGTEISFTSAKADYVLYENYFDTADDINSDEFTVYESDGTTLSSDKSVSSSNWAEGGYLNISGGTHQLTILKTGISDSNVADDAMLVFEARIKHSAGSESGQSSLTTVDYNSHPVFAVGSTMKAYGARIFSTGGGLGFLNMSGGTATTTIADYPIKRGVFYTYKITWDKANGNVKYSISNDEDETLKETEWQKFNNTTIDPNYIMLNSSRYFMASSVDYVRVYDETKLPHATISETDLSSLKDGSTLTINFEQKITESDLSKITVTGGAEIEKALSEDGKSVTLTFSNVETLKSYTLTVEDIGMNLGFTETLKGADYDYMLYRAEFDTAEEAGKENLKYYNGGSFEADFDASQKWVEGGYIKPDAQANWSLILETDVASKASDNAIIVYEARIKHSKGRDNAEATKVNNGSYPVFAAGALANTGGARIFAVGDGLAFHSSAGGNFSAPQTGYENYPINYDEFYTYKIIYNKATDKVKFSVENDTQGTMESTDWQTFNSTTFNPNYVTLNSSPWLIGSTIDYIHIYDETLIPVPTVSGADLMNLKSGDKLTINFPFAVTSEELAGKVKIGENVQSLSLSEDGKTAEFTLSDIALRTKYALTIEAVGKNPAVTEQLRGGEEGKYYYRAEFDGNDDTSKLYTQWCNRGFGALNTAEFLDETNGLLTTSNMLYRRPSVVFGKTFSSESEALANIKTEAINVEGKENVVLETKFKFDGDKDIYTGNNGTSFITVGFQGGSVAIGYGTPSENETEVGLMYAANAGNPNTYFIGKDDSKYKLTKGEWYTITVRMNFKDAKYMVTVSDTKGDVASSGSVNFMYNGKPTTISGIGLPSSYDNNYAPCYIDYVRLYDDDYGKTEVSYNNGTVDIPLEGNVFVTGSETFSFEALQEVTNPQITAKTADGESLTVSANANGKKVSFKITDSIPADTKVIVTIAKETLGSESDQTVSFRTKWDDTAEFVTPEMFANKDTLEVVFFGGSITYQSGWRTTVTNGLTEMFSGKTVNCYNESWGGTGAHTGWNRLDMNVKPHNPDVVFVEYAVNDSYDSEAAKWIESVIRSMNSWEKRPVIILVYTTVVDFNQNNFAVSEQTRVAEAYGVPYISVKDYVMSKYNEDSSFAADWDAKVYLTDGTHTATDADGFKLYGDYVNALLEHHSDHYFKLPKANSQVTKVVSDSKDEAMEYTAGKALDNESMTFTFSGDELMLLFNYGADKGSYTLVVDEKTVELEKSTHMTGSGVSRIFVSYDGFGDGEHTATITANSLTVDGSDYTKVDLTGYFQLPTAKAVFTKPEITIDGTTVKATFNYTTAVATDVTLILAAYKADGSLAEIQFVSTTVSAETTSASTTMPDSSDYDSFKAFVWDGLGSMQAKCVNGEYEKETTSAE